MFAKAWEHIKKTGVWIAGLLLLVLGAGWMWRRSKARLLDAKDKAAIADAQAGIERLAAVREEVANRRGEKDAAIVAIDHQIEEQKKIIKETLELGAGMTPEEIDEEFRHMGY